MAKPKLVFNLKEYSRLRKSPEMRRALREQAQRVESAAVRRSKGKYKISSVSESRTQVIRVGTADDKAARDSIRNNGLLKAMGEVVNG